MRAKTMILSTVLLFALAAPSLAEPQGTAAEEAQAVEQAVNKFYTSLNALFTGDAGPMLDTWSHSDDVTYMGPAGGYQVGWEQVESQWKAQAALKLGGKIEPSEVRVTVNGNLAAVHCKELGSNRDPQGLPVHVSIRATNLFRKENGEWKMIGHHTDLLPFLEKQTFNTPAK